MPYLRGCCGGHLREVLNEAAQRAELKNSFGSIDLQYKNNKEKHSSHRLHLRVVEEHVAQCLRVVEHSLREAKNVESGNGDFVVSDPTYKGGTSATYNKSTQNTKPKQPCATCMMYSR